MGMVRYANLPVQLVPSIEREGMPELLAMVSTRMHLALQDWDILEVLRAAMVWVRSKPMAPMSDEQIWAVLPPQATPQRPATQGGSKL